MKKLNVGIDLRALSRREFLGTALKGGIATAGVLMLPWDLALAEAKLNVGTMKIGDLSPFFLALERGFFKDSGLDINITAMVGGAAIAPALASGALNVGWSNVVSVYQAHLERFDYRFVANGAINKRATNDVFGFQVAETRPSSRLKILTARLSPQTPSTTSSTLPASIGLTATAATPPRSSGWRCPSRKWSRRWSRSTSMPALRWNHS